MKNFKYAPLYEPYKIGSLTIKNRFIMAPMGPLGLSDSEGGWNQRGIDYYARRAQGEVGLIITGVTVSDTTVESQSMPNLPNSTHNPVHFVRTSRELTERVHAYGTKIFLMMGAGFGRVAMPTNLGEFDAIAPSAIPHRWTDATCRPMRKDEIRAIVKGFGKGAYNAKRGGFDGIEVHAVHEGYLLDQFAISIFNQRDDEYGGSLLARTRFACDVLHAVRKMVGRKFPIIFRLSLLLPENPDARLVHTPEELSELLVPLCNAGVDIFAVDDSGAGAPFHGNALGFAGWVKMLSGRPVIIGEDAVSNSPSLELLSRRLAAQEFDLVAIGRALLADAEWGRKVREARVNEIHGLA